MSIIERARLFEYDLAYAHGTYTMSGGRAADSQRGLLVELTTDNGTEGWGECTPLGGTYLPASSGVVKAALLELLPTVLGHDPVNLASIWRTMDAQLLGNPHAKSAIDIATWDLRGKILGAPIADLLGGRLQDSFPLYEAVPLGTPDEMGKFIHTRQSAGVAMFQLKVGNDPAEDVLRALAAVEAANEDTIVIADANGGWNLLRAEHAIRGLSELPVFVEQPCRTTRDSAAAHRHSRLPLILDESVNTSSDLIEARDLAAAVAVNLKLSRVGGITQLARLRDLATSLGMMVCIEDTWGGDVTSAAVSHLAASTGEHELLTTSFFNDWTDGHVAGHRPRSQNGRGSAPTAPGLGIDVDTERIGPPVFDTADPTLRA